MSGLNRRIDQLLAGFADGDAISNAAVILRDACRQLGFESNIFAPPERVSPPLRDQCRPLHTYRAESSDLCLYHYGIASPATDFFTSTVARRVLIYHNITPAHFFEGFDDETAVRLREARRGLKSTAKAADAVWADSIYNASEIEALGVPPVHVFELPFDPRPLDTPPDPELWARRQAPLTTFLFIGRIAPNKRIEHLIEAFAWYHLTINRQSRLLVVGSNRSCPRYFTMLRMMVGDLDIPNVCLEGFASQAGLSAYYAVSDMYLSASEHEGYCLPLLEAMYKGLPVISRSVGGVPEAMRGAGVRYDALTPRELAELMHLILSDTTLRRNVQSGQHRRVKDALNRNIPSEIEIVLSPLL